MRILILSFISRPFILVIDHARFHLEAEEHAVIVPAICPLNTYRNEIGVKKQRICTEWVARSFLPVLLSSWIS